MKKQLIGLGITTLMFCGVGSAGATSVNVANLYGTATANSEYFGAGTDYIERHWTADKAIDGSFDMIDSWVAGGWATPSDRDWLVVDLGGFWDVTSIDVFWSPDDGLTDGYTGDVTLYYGADNSTWTEVSSWTFIDEVYQSQSFDFGSTGTNMRYVKFEQYGGTQWSHLTEISVWAAPVPEPVTMLLFGTGLVGLVGSRIRKKKQQ